jgi:hypothetical protein
VVASKQGAKLDVIRLQPRDGKSRPAKVRKPSPVHKLVIRLLPLIDEHLRSVMRYRGDLSAMIIEAIGAVDLKSVRLVELAAESRLRSTTIALPPDIHDQLKALAKSRSASMNIMVNTAVAHWLAAQKVIRLV